MKFRSWRYYFKEATTCLFRNGLMTLASVGTVASCIFILVVSFCVAVNLDFILQQFGSSLGFTVIITDKATTEEVSGLRDQIAQTEYVTGVKYITAQEALEDLKQQFNDTSGILSGLEEDNPLPRSFEINIEDPKYQTDVVSAINKLNSPAIEELRYESEVINMLVTINNGIRLISLAIILGLTVVSIVIIMNTVKLTVNNRKVEISIMKYVGATDWFIRWPFVIEGVLIGVLGAIIPVLLCWLTYGRIIGFLYENMRLVQNLITFRTSMEVLTFLAPISILLGMAIGAFGSITSIRKYLKV